MTNRDRTLILHIGYAKTATTFLQEHIFPNLDEVEFLGRKVGVENDQEFTAWTYSFAKDPSFDLKVLDEIIQESSPEKVLISNEVILRPFNYQDSMQRLGKLRKQFNKVQVIVSIRQQSDLIFSRFAHDLERSIFRPYEMQDALDPDGNRECLWPMCNEGLMTKLWRKSPFKGGSCLCNAHKNKSINLPYYDFNNMDLLLSEIFGLENVHVVISEALRSDIKQEVYQLSNFLNIESLPESFYDRLKHASSNERRSSAHYQSLKKKYSENGMLLELKEKFKSSNAELAERRNLRLDQFQY